MLKSSVFHRNRLRFNASKHHPPYITTCSQVKDYIFVCTNAKCLDLDVVQLGLLKGLLLGLQKVWDQVVGVLLSLDSLAWRQQLVRDTTLVGSDETEVSGIRDIGRQTGNGLLCNRALLDD